LWADLLTTRRVLVLGDSITHAGGWVVAVESRLRCLYPDRRLELVSLGLPSETIGDHQDDGEHARRYGFPRPVLSHRLAATLDALRPQVVVACYGMNDGHGAAWDEACFASFQAGQLRLRDAARSMGAQVIHCTPPAYDPDAPQPLLHPCYDQVLARYSSWLLERRGDGWLVADMRKPMVEALGVLRRCDPRAFFSQDGVHPDLAGHWTMARGLFAAMGDGPAVSACALSDLLPGPLQELPELVRQRQEVLRDAWLCAIPHTRPGLPCGLPVEEATEAAERLERRISGLLSTVR
jgi:lysophospholipase L1-like esterase